MFAISFHLAFNYCIILTNPFEDCNIFLSKRHKNWLELQAKISNPNANAAALNIP